jgi:hypothetical protein
MDVFEAMIADVYYIMRIEDPHGVRDLLRDEQAADIIASKTYRRWVREPLPVRTWPKNP